MITDFDPQLLTIPLYSQSSSATIASTPSEAKPCGSTSLLAMNSRQYLEGLKLPSLGTLEVLFLHRGILEGPLAGSLLVLSAAGQRTRPC